MELIIKYKKDFKPNVSLELYEKEFNNKIESIKKETPDWERRILPQSPNFKISKPYLICFKENKYHSYKIYETGIYIYHTEDYIFDQLRSQACFFIHSYNNKWNEFTKDDFNIEEARKKIDGWFDCASGLMFDYDKIDSIYSYED